MNKINKILLLFLFLLLFNFKLIGVQKIDDLSFTNTDINQVLKVISEIFAVTIVPDKDVQGQVTRYFKDTDLTQTLVLLLEPLDYIYEEKDGIYFVKKRPAFNIEYNEQTRLFNISSNNANLQDVINSMSKVSKQTISFIGSPSDKINIYIFNKTMEECLKIFTDNLNYKYEKRDNSFVVKKDEPEQVFSPTDTNRANIVIKGDEDKIQLKVYNKNSNDVLIALFTKYQKKASLLSDRSIRIPYLDVDNISFDNLLDILCQHSQQSFMNKDGIYYIYDSMNARNINPYRITATYKLKNLTYKSFSLIVPAQIVPQTAYKIDAENNIVLVFGSPVEVDLYLDYIKKIDMNLNQFEYRLFKLKNLDVRKIMKYLPPQFQRLTITTIEEQNMFSVYVDNEDYEYLKNYLNEIDQNYTKDYVYKFKYLDPDEVMNKLLPKNTKKEQFTISKNTSSLIFNGFEEVKNDVWGYFDTIDVPPPIIKYQLLIVEYLHESTFVLDWGVGVKQASNITDFQLTSGGIFAGGSDSIGANFNIPIVFGYYFSAFLDLKLKEHLAKIQMSTEVSGMSGETLNVTNTKTTQFVTYKKNADGTVSTDPVLNPITTGLNLDIKGRATSAEEIYMEIQARISDQYATEKGSAPNTSEKSVKNFVRTKSGKPIILGGLMSKSESTNNKKIPGLADIPYIGNMFKTHDNNYSDSEFVIYVIPFIQKSLNDLKKERQEYIKNMYEYFVKS